MKLPVAKPIDRLLNGGLETGCITNFYGPSASGKTQIAMQATVSCIKHGKKVVFIDTEGGFSFDRLEQLTDGNTKKFMDKIILMEVKTWQEQKSAIKKLEKLTKEKIGLVVVDSLVALWRVEVNDKNAQEINKELALQLSILSKIAREKNIPVLITNQVYSDITTGKVELSGRNIVKWWSKNIVELIHSGRSGIRIARIMKARALPEDKKIEFQITSDGLKDIKFKIF